MKSTFITDTNQLVPLLHALWDHAYCQDEIDPIMTTAMFLDAIGTVAVPTEHHQVYLELLQEYDEWGMGLRDLTDDPDRGWGINSWMVDVVKMARNLCAQIAGFEGYNEYFAFHRRLEEN